MAPRLCCVPHCSGGRKKQCLLFEPPLAIPSVWAAWKKACPFLLEFDPLKLRRIRFCDIHFRDGQILGPDKLTDDAVPSLNLPTKGPPGSDKNFVSASCTVVSTGSWSKSDSKTDAAVKAKLNEPECVLCGRAGSEPGIILTRFPWKLERCMKWVKMIGLEELAHKSVQTLYDTMFLCQYHFTEGSFIGKTLKGDEVPSENLPHKPLDDMFLLDFVQAQDTVPAEPVKAEPCAVCGGAKKDDDNKTKFDEINVLFLSYAGTFRKLNRKFQTMLKLDLAKIFARYEMKNTVHNEERRKQEKLQNRMKRINNNKFKPKFTTDVPNLFMDTPKTTEQTKVTTNISNARINKPLVKTITTHKTYSLSPNSAVQHKKTSDSYTPNAKTIVKSNVTVLTPQTTAQFLNKNITITQNVKPNVPIETPQAVIQLPVTNVSAPNSKRQLNPVSKIPTNLPTLTPKPGLISKITSTSSNVLTLSHISGNVVGNSPNSKSNVRVVKLMKTNQIPKAILEMHKQGIRALEKVPCADMSKINTMKRKLVTISPKVLPASPNPSNKIDVIDISKAEQSGDATPHVNLEVDPLEIPNKVPKLESDTQRRANLVEAVCPSKITLSDGSVLEGFVLDSMDTPSPEIVILPDGN